MNNDLDAVLTQFLRSRLKTFTSADALLYISAVYSRFNKKEAVQVLQTHPLAVQLDEDIWISRAGLFTGRSFSFKPSRFEIENNFLVCGHRCIPFTDPELLPNEICFSYSGTKIAKKTVTVPTYAVIERYSLLGEEFVPQYIAVDPANNDVDFSANDFELPASINITVFDMKDLFAQWDFSAADRIECVLSDWNAGVVEIEPHKLKKENRFEQNESDAKREHWFSSVEKSLLEVFDVFGPCGTIDEQLLFAYAHFPDVMFSDESGSIEELLARSKKIALEIYGVETRLWRKDEEIPVTGIWNAVDFSDIPEEYELETETGLPIPDHIIEAMVLDSLFMKEKNVSQIPSRLFPDTLVLGENDRNALLLHLQKKHDILAKQYNWFADYTVGSLRHESLDLYSKLFELACELDFKNIPILELPQQPLVVMSQLLGHISRLITSLLTSEQIQEKDINAVRLSLEGMQMSYEETSAALLEDLKKHQKEGFFVIKKTEDKDGQRD